MKTHDLAAMLAHGVEASDPRTVEKRFALAMALGLAGAAALMLPLLGVRSDLAQALGSGGFWLKLVFPAALLCAALSVGARLARPGRNGGRGWWLAVAALAALWAGGALVLAHAAPAARVQLLLGNSWQTCTLLVALLSLPAFCAASWALRGLAPTRPREAGAAAGLFAGAQGLLVYCLHCPETAVSFWAVWYVLGLAVPTGLGAALGKAILRW
ncbi:hypothetical protein B0920_19795 [Massilia sp. KIM]|uniref:DUF1109 domain-containing protein n=1 Tax=Massilia sp. KIM TaxID=1955422 RepID=UPI00098FBC44|nr:DUF1109 domain-containing protein [Massilia sp. KIM]OON61164.1 hypothetical protein B0920_19795 [Massilia sp. KIM]